MNKVTSLDENYSTTRFLTRERPMLLSEGKFESILFLSEGKGRIGEGGLRTRDYFKQSYPGRPLISIVTVVYNGAKHLEQTILSVLKQSYPNVEYLIIDGGSTDGTLEIIRQYEEAIDYWISETDKGIYDAMNKGISLASGDYIVFLNADDWYERGAIESVAQNIIKSCTQER